MSLRLRLILAFFLILVAGFAYLVQWLSDDVRPRYLGVVEETLVDVANAMAAQVSVASADGKLRVAPLRAAMQDASGRTFTAQIYDHVKKGTDLRVYVTDAQGIVQYDSRGQEEGKDFSKWNDVFLTLKGQYGARSTREIPDDDRTSNLHVAAPITVKGKLLGVLTVVKPTGGIAIFVAVARQKFFTAGIITGFGVLLIGLLTSAWLTRPIRELTDFARAARDGKRVPLPELGRGELRMMGEAFEEMRSALDGKKYIENYVQTLTHELKSPLSAIRGAAELLQEGMPEEKRARFLANILDESQRLHEIVDRLLELSAVEARSGLRDAESLDLRLLAQDAIAAIEPVWTKKKLRVELAEGGPAHVRGEKFLLRQAFTNLLHNAIDFAPEGSRIVASVRATPQGAILRVEDSGPGLPEYALSRVFEKFYSLERPKDGPMGGRKSSGLGLCFVREVARIHGGDAAISNRPGGGATAEIRLGPA